MGDGGWGRGSWRMLLFGLYIMLVRTVGWITEMLRRLM